MQALLDAIRRALPAATWSRGVNIVREGRVLLPDDLAAQLKRRAEEIEIQVLPARGGAAATVMLYVQDAEWDCDCAAAATQDACEHTAAAAIAAGQAASGKAPGAQAAPAGSGAAAAAPAAQVILHVTYQFVRHREGLGLRRLLLSPATNAGAASEEELAVPLRVRQQAAGPKLVTQASDIAVDTLIAGRRLPGALPRTLLTRILQALVDAPHVRLDQAPIQVGEAMSAATIRLSPRPGGDVWMQMQRPNGLQEMFANGAARFGKTLRPLVELVLPSREQEVLARGEHFAQDRLPELVNDVLPRLARHMHIDWGKMQAPTTVDAKPRLHFVLDSWAAEVPFGSTAEGPGILRILPQIVYGEPALARVVGGKLRATGRAIVKRQVAQEAAMTEALRVNLDMRPDAAVTLRGEQAVIAITRVRAFAARHNAVIEDPDGRAAAWRTREPLRPLVQTEDGLENFFFVGDDAARTRISANTVLAAYARGEQAIALPDGGFAPLPARFLAVHGEALRSFLEARDTSRMLAAQSPKPQPLPAWAQASLGAMCEAAELPSPPAAQKAWAALQAQAATAAETPIGPLPAGIVLRPYQSVGVSWLRARAAVGIGSLLADDMGLGKTLQALLACEGLTLVVAPTSVVHNWAAEAARFCPKRPVRLYHGANRSLKRLSKNTLVITSYGVLRLDATALAEIAWRTCVLDEAHTIKSAHTQVAQSAFTVGQSAYARIALSGTPLENRLEELWSLLHFLNPGMFGTQQQFVGRYQKELLNAAPTAGGSALANRLAPLVLRRKKSAVAADLPAKSEVVLRCTLSDAERNIYDAIALTSRADVARKLAEGGSVIEALEALLRLRQAACHPALLPGHEDARSSAKVDALVETLEQAVAEGHRALVFSQWTRFLDLIEPHLKKSKLDFVRLDGNTRDRAAVVRTFSDAKGPPIMLISLKAGGVGLNLTAADHVFLMDPWWNPATEDQAADRAHRIGQTRKVMVHRLIAADTVEERLVALQQSKRTMAERALSDDAEGSLTAQSTSLSRAALLALLSDS